MRVLRPELAAWLLLVPLALLLWLAHYRYKWTRRAAERPAPFARRTTRARDAGVVVLSVAALTLLGLAIVRPQLRAERRTPVFERRDLVLVLDRSVSMRARDIPPSRFDRAVEEIRHFLRRKPDTIDRVGLVGFAGTSIVLSYPTEDLANLFFYMDWVREDPTPFFGTDIGSALTSALAASRRDKQPAPPVFVVISDGDDQGPELEAAANAVSRAGIRVHAIGIGSFEAVPMPVVGEDGRETLLKDEDGAVLRTQFDETTLQRLAAMTGGRYFRSVTGGELRTALDRIAADERRQVGWTTTVEYRDLYLALLAAAGAMTLALITLL